MVTSSTSILHIIYKFQHLVIAFNSLLFYIKLRILSLATTWRLLAWLDRRRSPALSFTPNSQTFILSSLSPSSGKLDLFFYHPLVYDPQVAKENNYPIVVVLHGGGWCVGHARHGERFIATLSTRSFCCRSQLPPRTWTPLSRSTPGADCLDAILTWKHAAALGLDKHRTFITGFSVGGTMALAR